MNIELQMNEEVVEGEVWWVKIEPTVQLSKVVVVSQTERTITICDFHISDAVSLGLEERVYKKPDVEFIEEVVFESEEVTKEVTIDSQNINKDVGGFPVGSKVRISASIDKNYCRPAIYNNCKGEVMFDPNLSDGERAVRVGGSLVYVLTECLELLPEKKIKRVVIK